MRRLSVWFVLAGVAQTLNADHIPGHNAGDPVFPVPLPTRDFFDGGAAFVSAIGPAPNTEFFGTTFDLTYVSDGIEPARDLAISVSYLTPEFELVEFDLTGADLGFTSGPGTFHGVFTTDALNGVIRESFLTPGGTLINVDIGSVDGFIDGSGYFVDSFIRFDVVPEPGSASMFLVLTLAASRRLRLS